MKVFINESILASANYWQPQDKDDFESNMQALLDSLHCFQFFNESQVYFSSAGLKSLIDQLSFINEYNEYALFNPIEQLRQRIIDIEADDWSQDKIQRDDHHYIAQLGGGFVPYPINGTSLAEATEYKHIGHKAVLLNFPSSEFNVHRTIHVNRSAINPPPGMDMISIDCICTKEDSITYYLKYRNPVAYNHNPKHGENHTKVIMKDGEIISPLECTQAEATVFIKKTVGGEKNTDLFAYDETRNKFIRFKYDSVNNDTQETCYHAFYPHDQKISQEVKSFLTENQSIFDAFFQE